MAGVTLEKDKIIYTYDQPMTSLHLITEGKVTANYPGGSYQLGKGDVIGICEICFDVHLIEYIAAEDNTTFLTYPISNLNVLSDLLQKHTDAARFFMLSAFRQITILQNRCSLSEMDCSNLYRNFADNLEKYNRLCDLYRLKPRKLDGAEEIHEFLSDENPDLWLTDYYIGLSRLYKADNYTELLKEPAVSLGNLRKCSLDFRKTWLGLEEQYRYLQQLAGYYMNETENDLFGFLTSLYGKMDAHAEERPELLADIKQIARQLRDLRVIPEALFEKRVEQFRSTLVQNTPDTTGEQPAENTALPAQFSSSLNTILEFAGEDYEGADSFRQHVVAYRQLPDKNSTEDDANRLRRVLTQEFYALYRQVFIRTLKAKDIPAPVRMFLCFGYVDEELAGTENTALLYELLSGMGDHTKSGLYTFYDWLLAIYQGRKEPSRNEFEQDYNDYIHKQKAMGNITDDQLKKLEKSGSSKVDYELQNMFETVNKITFGRVTTFCPLFTKENVLKDLKSSFVSISKINRALEQVRKVDFSVFYRPGIDMEHVDVMGREAVHKEVLPDIILMPNAGIRGVMWQEIEGRYRNTPSRMIFSIFFLEDLTSSFLHMTGEFRWEMCRRIQGARWNDLSERSLTSEYFDYIQFYRKNRDLSADAKERVRTSLQRAKNSYKEMFVRDYVVWVLFEGSGSPRLNKVAREILFTYCPFSANIRKMLEQNPLYGELLHKHAMRCAQNLHRLNGLRKKLLNSGQPVPNVLEEECAYYKM